MEKRGLGVIEINTMTARFALSRVRQLASGQPLPDLSIIDPKLNSL